MGSVGGWRVAAFDRWSVGEVAFDGEDGVGVVSVAAAGQQPTSTNPQLDDTITETR
ncbi:MAG: hypothetical protein ACR2N7_12740 [Acidimicrobiia bacterium]